MTTAAVERTTLRALIAGVVESGVVDPSEIAGKVMAQVPEADLRAALDEALRPYVVHVLSTRRYDLNRAHPTGGRTRVDAVRDWYRAWLLQPMHAGGVWKPLGECTRTDLLEAVRERREHARRTALIADQLEALAQELADRRLVYVNQLPREVAERVTGRAS